jgi:ribosome-binding protein aMBF1 (putative translation factor)
MSERSNRTKGKALTPEEQAKLDEARRIWRSPEYQAKLSQDIEDIKEEFPPKEAPLVVVEFLAKIRRERERQGLSLSDLERRTGIKGANLSKLETGKHFNPTIATMETLASALGMRVVLDLEPA